MFSLNNVHPLAIIKYYREKQVIHCSSDESSSSLALPSAIVPRFPFCRTFPVAASAPGTGGESLGSRPWDPPEVIWAEWEWVQEYDNNEKLFKEIGTLALLAFRNQNLHFSCHKKLIETTFFTLFYTQQTL